MIGSFGGQATWYLTRGSGVVALLLLTASLTLGLVSAARWESHRWPRFVIEGLHRNVSLLVLVFIAIHVATTVLDGFVPIGWMDAVVPFTAGYRPVWVGLGALAVDCLLAIVITSLLRVRIGSSLWRSVHWLSYACWPIAVIHGLGTGTDTPRPWMLATVGVCVTVVLASLWWRVVVRRPQREMVLPMVIAASIALAALVALFIWLGPSRPGWGTHGGRIGTPAQIAADSPS